MCAGTFLLSCPPILRPSRASICKRAWDAGEFVNGIGIGETGNGGKEREAYRDGTESSLPPPRATASRHLTDTSACGIADPCCKAAAKKKKKGFAASGMSHIIISISIGTTAKTILPRSPAPETTAAPAAI